MSPEARLAALPLWRGKPEIRRIAAGRTNQNYLVEYDGKRFFARIGVDIPQHGISRTAEKSCAGLAAAAGLAPEILYAEHGILVTAFLDGETLDMGAVQSPALMAEIAQALRRLHTVPAQRGLPDFCPVAVSRRYLAALPDESLPRPRGQLAAAIERLPSPAPRCLVHGDLIPENFLRTPQGLRLIDWEYAGNGVPETDLALVLGNFGLTGAAAEAFLAAYGPANRKLIEDLRVAAIIREALWCLTQARLGGNVGDLPRYTALCLQRLAQVLG